MNSRQESRLSMLREVKGYLEQHTAVTGQLPNFGVYFAKLETALNKAGELALGQMSAQSGQGLMKQRAREALTGLTIDMARRVKAFAMLGGNMELAAQTNISKRRMMLVADTVAANTARGVLHKATENAPVLGPYGVGSAELGALEGAIAAYEAVLSAPRTAIAKRKSVLAGFALQLEEAMAVLKFIDMLVEIVKDEQGGFYDGYRSARKLKNHSLRHLAMRGKVSDAATGKGLGGVKVELALDAAWLEVKWEKEIKRLMRSRVLLVKKTYNKGGWWVKHMKEGTWHLRASLVGYATHVETVYVVKGEMKVVEVEMERLVVGGE